MSFMNLQNSFYERETKIHPEHEFQMYWKVLLDKMILLSEHTTRYVKQLSWGMYTKLIKLRISTYGTHTPMVSYHNHILVH